MSTSSNVRRVRARRDKCSLDRAAEGVLFPRHLTADMDFPIYRKAFCRTLPLTYDSTGKMPDGYPVYLYKFRTEVFNSSLDENRCYCPQDGCLPSGLSDISPCYYSESNDRASLPPARFALALGAHAGILTGRRRYSRTSLVNSDRRGSLYRADGTIKPVSEHFDQTYPSDVSRSRTSRRPRSRRVTVTRYSKIHRPSKAASQRARPRKCTPDDTPRRPGRLKDILKT